MHSDCVFCKIVSGEEPSWIVWEDEDFLAFLTPFPNTKGFTVVASKEHWPSDVLSLKSKELHGLMDAAKLVAKILNQAFDCQRTAFIGEGFGVDHAHVKLIPLHGLDRGPWKQVKSSKAEVYDRYPGHVSSHDGPKVADKILDVVADKIRHAAKNS